MRALRGKPLATFACTFLVLVVSQSWIKCLFLRGYDARRSSTTSSTSSTSRRSWSATDVPVLIVALDGYQISNAIPRHTIPFMCERNRVVVLSDAKQRHLPAHHNLQLERVSGLSSMEMSWPPNAPLTERLFFHRWYIIRDWMRRTGTERVMTLDGDGVMLLNVTKFVQENFAKISTRELWVVHEPPRSSWAFALVSRRGLEDVTAFWNFVFAPENEVWTAEFVNSAHLPNDMVALGHYAHSAAGKPYPCWGFGSEHAAGSCDGVIDYGFTPVLDRLIQKGVRAKYVPSTLTLDELGEPPFEAGVVDSHLSVDHVRRFEMKDNSKRMRFQQGQPQLQLKPLDTAKTERWVVVWGYILEDDLERCVDVHLKYIRTQTSCTCINICCRECVSSKNSHGWLGALWWT